MKSSFLYKVILFPFALFIFISFFSCCQNSQALKRHQTVQHWFSDNDKIKIVATTAIIADLIKKVGGPYVDVLTLIPDELDPHSYQLVKGDNEKFSFASLIFYNGLGLEHGPSLAAYLSKNQKSFALGDYLLATTPENILFFNDSPDPHIWMDLSLWAKSIPFVVEKLAMYDPQHAENYKSNGLSAIEELSKANRRIKNLLHQIPSSSRYLVTSHDAFNYFARAYLAGENENSSGKWRERFHAPEGLAPESQISCQEIRSVVDYLKKHDIQVIFPETNVSIASLRKVIDSCKELGMTVFLAKEPLYSDALGPESSQAYTHIGMVEYNAKTIAYALRR